MKRNTPILRCLNWLACMCLVPASHAQEIVNAEVATLIYTSAERAKISQVRQPLQGAVAVESLKRFSGVVKRTDGRDVVWMNHQAQTKNDPSAPQLEGAEVVLQGTRLRVGDAIDTKSGSRKSLVPEGAILKDQ
jgi:hypothetical protein